MDPQSIAALEILRVAHNLGVCARLGIAADSTDESASAAYDVAAAQSGRNVPRTHDETIYDDIAAFLPPMLSALVVSRKGQIVDAIGRAVVADPSKLPLVLSAAGIKTSLGQ